METVSGETRALRRTIRDLIALSALPAVWAGCQPRQVAEGLADVLFSTLRLDLVYLRLRSEMDGPEIEVCRTAGPPTTTEQLRDIRTVLAPSLEGTRTNSPPAIPNPVGDGTVHLLIAPIGFNPQHGVLIAGSQQTAFPSEGDRLLLSVGVNQAAAVLQRERDQKALRESSERFRIVARATNDAVWDWDLGTNKVWWNEGVLTLFGYRLEQNEANPAWWLERIHPEDRAAVEESIFEVICGTKPSWVDEYRFRCADGSYKDVYDRGYVLRDGEGRAVRMIGAMLDITPRKRLEEELSQAHARLELAVRGANITIHELNMPDGVLENCRWKFVSVANQLGGFDRSELPSDFATLMAFVYPDDRERVVRAMRAYLSGQTREYTSEGRVRHRDGSYHWILARGVAVRDAEGRAIRFMISSIDITDLKRAEETLRESEHRWRSLAEALPQLVWTATPDGRWDYGSAQIVQYMGRPESDLLGWGWLELLHPEDRERIQKAWRAAVAGQSDYEIEHHFRRFDGTYRWFKTRGVAVRDSEGNIYKWFGTCTDITTDKQLEEELRRANERLDLAVRGSNICIWENDMPDGDPRHGRPYQLNYWEQLGYERPDFPPDYETGMASIDPDDRALVGEAMRSYLAGETSKFEVEFRVRHKDGSYRWMLTRGVAVRDAGGKPIRFVGSGVDITDLKRLDAELRRAKEAAEAANRAKDEFLANVSHEIRTPMNAILGMTELALETGLTEDQRQCLQTVKSAADNLLGIINALLDFAKIEAGKLELDPADFSLRTTLRDTLRALATRAHKKGLELACNIQPNVPDALVGDAARLRQVLLNLVGNAIKFTEHGEVVVQVDVVSGGVVSAECSQDVSFNTHHAPPTPPPLTTHLRFTVRDTGIGIPDDKQEKIFQAFEQEDTSTTRKYGGTGLGLAIAARLVALMGGSITVQSEPGRGSTFAFTAQFGRQEHAPEQTAAWLPVLLKGLRVLVVDDNPTNRQILVEWLRGWQMEPIAVGDGLAALGALWDAVSIGRPYPLVLLDARMPDTDGLALAARIRERAALSAVRIILLTSDHHPSERARSRELRIDALLLKPVQQDELLETIYRVMTRAQGDAPTAVEEPAREPSPVPAAVPLRILLAEDDEFSAQLMDKLLARRGHRMRLASNGREALVLAVQGGFDLMLLDLHMPELDGLEVVRGIREHERVAGGHLPVIALTARSRQEDRERCLAAGMDDFLTKPVAAADLLTATDRLLRKDEGGRTKDEKDKTPAVDSSFILHPSSFGKGLLDPVAVLTTCGDDAEALRGMCRAFATYLPIRVAEVSDALRAEDAPRLREAAHKLAALLFAFSQTAGNAASDLEDQAAQGRLAEARPLVERLEAMAQELLPQVGGLSVDALRHQVGTAAEPGKTAGP